MRLSVKKIGFGAAAALAVAGAVALLWPAPLAVQVAAAARGALQVTVDEEGRTRVRDRYVVAAPVAGRVARIGLEAGDSVARGTVVARVYPAPLDPRAREQAVARVDEAEDAQRAADAATAQARATLAQARRTRARAEELAAKNLIAPEERERAELEETNRSRELEAAEFRAQAAAHDVEVARGALAGAPALALRSPVCGRVLRIPEKSERVVPAGASLLELGDCSKLEIVIDLLSADAVEVRPGDPVLIEEWGGDRPLVARVRTIEPSAFTKVSALGVEEQRVHVIADFLDAPVPLADGYRVEARIVIWEGANILKIPSSALFRHGDGWSVFVVDQGRARQRDVQVGHRTPFEAEIVQGLTAGDVVVLHPSDQIADGVKVRASWPTSST